MKSKFLIILLILNIPFSNCKKEKYRPEGVPQDASYEKKRNLYTQIKDGKRKIWTKEGDFYSECLIDELGREHGECKNFFPGSGKLITIGNNIHGERDGVWYWYFPNGNIYYKLTLAHDKKRPVWIETNLLGNEHGAYERYYEDGSLEEKGSYDTGYKTDYWEKFYKDGQLEYTGYYKKDKKIKDWKYYFSDGKLEVEENFTGDGKLISRKTYFPDGNLNCEVIPAESKLDCK
ncbi:MAG: hypothetical protein KDK36_10270 [Leptospiraceae bacterium]|nr:hypothetical protein [Leptospiraceae bacterium]